MIKSMFKKLASMMTSKKHPFNVRMPRQVVAFTMAAAVMLVSLAGCGVLDSKPGFAGAFPPSQRESQHHEGGWYRPGEVILSSDTPEAFNRQVNAFWSYARATNTFPGMNGNFPDSSQVQIRCDEKVTNKLQLLKGHVMEVECGYYRHGRPMKDTKKVVLKSVNGIFNAYVK